jgi:hypothetical protein
LILLMVTVVWTTNAMTYEYLPEDCDVADRERLVAYRAKRSEWLRLLDDDPQHSISKQLSAMQWNDVAYRCFNEARRFASAAQPTSAVAPMLGEFLDVGYVATQVLAISKLLERNPKDPNKSVISLRRVVEDLAEHRQLLTREMFICHDGLPYDPAPARERFYTALASQPGSKAAWVATREPEGWGTVELMHTTFDRLSGVTSAQRSRDDLIRTDIFDALELGLKQPVFTTLLQLRHKLIAHAADSNNRPNSLQQATLNDLLSAHRILVKTAHTIGATLLFESGAGGLPTPQFDQFEHLQHPFINPNNLEDLEKSWNDQSKIRDEWLRQADAELLAGKPPA